MMAKLKITLLLALLVVLTVILTVTTYPALRERAVRGERRRPITETQFSIDYLLDIEMSDDEVPYIILFDSE